MEKTSLFGDCSNAPSAIGTIHNFKKVVKSNPYAPFCHFDLLGADGELYPFSTKEGPNFPGIYMRWSEAQLKERIIVPDDTRNPAPVELGQSELPLILQSGALWLDLEILTKTIVTMQGEYIEGAYTWEAFKLYFRTNTTTGDSHYDTVPFGEDIKPGNIISSHAVIHHSTSSNIYRSGCGESKSNMQDITKDQLTRYDV